MLKIIFFIPAVLIILPQCVFAHPHTHHEQSRALLPSITPLCNVLCYDGANWRIYLPVEKVLLAYDQLSNSLVIIQDNLAFIFMRGLNCFVILDKTNYIHLYIGKNRYSYTFNQQTTADLFNIYNDAQRGFVALQNIRNFVIQNFPQNGGILNQFPQFSKLPEPIRTALLRFIMREFYQTSLYINGAELFSSIFGLLSLLRGVQMNQVSSIDLLSDSSWNVLTQNAQFGISSSGKIIQNGVATGSLNLNQKGQFPGGVPVASNAYVSYGLQDLSRKYNCILDPLLNTAGTTLGLSGVTNPLASTLDGVAGAVRPVLNNLSGGLTESVIGSLGNIISGIA